MSLHSQELRHTGGSQASGSRVDLRPIKVQVLAPVPIFAPQNRCQLTVITDNGQDGQSPQTYLEQLQEQAAHFNREAFVKHQEALAAQIKAREASKAFSIALDAKLNDHRNGKA